MSQVRTSYRHLVDSLMITLKSVFADAEIYELQVLYWVIAGVNSVKRTEMEAGRLTGSYLQSFTAVPVVIQTNEGNNIFAKRKYIELPANIVDLKDDRAIDYICYYKLQVKPLQTTKGKPIVIDQDTLNHVIESYHSPFQRPTQDNPKWVRVNNLLYLFGVEDAVLRTVDMALYTSIAPSVLTIELDDEVLLDDEQIGKVLNYVTSLGRFMLSVPAQDRSMVMQDTREPMALPRQSTTTNTQS